MTQAHPAVTLSLRVSPEIRDQLEGLSDATGRTKSFLAAEAIEGYLAVHAWQVKCIEDAITKVDSKRMKLIPHHQVENWVNSWDSEEEEEPPK